jgi:hypothetical protein
VVVTLLRTSPIDLVEHSSLSLKALRLQVLALMSVSLLLANLVVFVLQIAEGLLLLLASQVAHNAILSKPEMADVLVASDNLIASLIPKLSVPEQQLIKLQQQMLRL